MKNNYIILDFKIVWVLVILSLLLTFISITSKILHWKSSQILLTLGLFFTFLAWIIILSDMVMKKIYHKRLWIMMMFFLPNITVIFYLFQRNALLRLGKKFAKLRLGQKRNNFLLLNDNKHLQSDQDKNFNK